MSSENFTSLVPVVYYDLIARVACGAPFAAVIAWELNFDNWGHGFLVTLMLFGGGYLLGSLLAPVSAGLSWLMWRNGLIRYVNSSFDLVHPLPKSASLAFAELYRRIDYVSGKDRYKGSVLEKMDAGAAFAENLLAGLSVCWILQGFGFLEVWPWYWYLILFVYLLITGVFRRLLLVVRQDRVYHRVLATEFKLGEERDV